MTLLAGLAVGVFVYFLVGYATGYTPEIKIRRFRRRTQISNRQLWLNQAGMAVVNTHCSRRGCLARIVSATSDGAMLGSRDGRLHGLRCRLRVRIEQ
jgi:hypothetical protein